MPIMVVSHPLIGYVFYTDVLHFHGPIQNENRDPLREFVTIISIGFDD